MNRVHIHLHTTDLTAARHFYTRLLGKHPTRVKEDYLQWRLDEPALNLAVTLGEAPGVSHLGLDLEDGEALETIRARISAETDRHEEIDVSCCYRRSDKVWYADPDGISWETFHSFEDAEELAQPGTRCCA